MYSKNTLLERNRLILAALYAKKPPYKPNGGTEEFLYNSLKLSAFLLFNDFNPKKSDEKKSSKKLDELISKLSDIVNTLHETQNKNLRLEILRQFLIKFALIIDHTISCSDISKTHQDSAHKIYEYQDRIQTAIQVNLNHDFKLPIPFNLGSITEEYNKAYDKEYGQGPIGFFKLPIKKYFQQKTRTDELQFLNKVEQFCNRRAFNDSEVELIKLSAANLVLMNISTETFGNGSILGKILKARLNDSNLVDKSNTFMDEMMSKFLSMGIPVPKHLAELYEKGMERSSTAGMK